MTAKKPTKAKTQGNDEYTECVPIKACRSWASAARQARGALCFIVNDGKESAANRIKAAELILARAEGLPARASEAGEPPPTVEEWLEKQEGQSRL